MATKEELSVFWHDLITGMHNRGRIECPEEMWSSWYEASKYHYGRVYCIIHATFIDLLDNDMINE